MTAYDDSVEGKLAAALMVTGFFDVDRTPEEIDAEIDRRMSGVLTSVPLFRVGHEEPHWLRPLADFYEAAEQAARGERKPVFATFSAPSQVGKSDCGEVSLARWIIRNPTHRLATISYGTDLSHPRSKRIRSDVQMMGVRLRGDSTAVQHWETAQGGGLLSVGLEGPLTGQPGLSLLEVDDPYKNRQEAESPAHRRMINDILRGVLASRLNPRTSMLFKLARWATDDVIGFIQSEYGDIFEHHRIPVWNDDGTLNIRMGGRDEEHWKRQRTLMGEHDWWSLMQGLPRPREGRLFKGVVHGTCPNDSARVAIGLDFAYSTATTADWSVAVVLKQHMGRYYVHQVIRRQCTAPEFGRELKTLQMLFPGAPMRAYLGGKEGGVGDWLKAVGVHVEALPAHGDKYARAQPVAAAWEAGMIAVDPSALWVAEFVKELHDFSGKGDRHDDQVDAFAAAFDALPTIPFTYSPQIVGGTYRQHEGRPSGIGMGQQISAMIKPGWKPGMPIRKKWE